MTYLPPIPENFKPRRKRPAEPPRRRVHRIETWPEYETARIKATNQPGPAGEADRQAALRFVADLIPGDIANIYLADIRRGRRQ